MKKKLLNNTVYPALDDNQTNPRFASPLLTIASLLGHRRVIIATQT